MQPESIIAAALAFIVGALVGKIFNKPVTVINENHTHIVTDDYGEDGECVPVGGPYLSDEEDDDEYEDDEDDRWNR